MKTTLALAAVAMLALGAATAPAGSSSSAGCGPTIEIRDPGLRAHFEQLERVQSVSAGKVCAFYRNEHAALTR